MGGQNPSRYPTPQGGYGQAPHQGMPPQQQMAPYAPQMGGPQAQLSRQGMPQQPQQQPQMPPPQMAGQSYMTAQSMAWQYGRTRCPHSGRAGRPWLEAPWCSTHSGPLHFRLERVPRGPRNGSLECLRDTVTHARYTAI